MAVKGRLIPVPNLDDRDWQAIRDAMVAEIPARCPEWTDLNPSDPGVTLIEVFAVALEELLYRQNQVLRKHMLEYLNMIGVTLTPASVAKTSVVFTLSGPQTFPVTIHKGFEVSTAGSAGEAPVVFTTDEDLVIDAGEPSGTVPASNASQIDEEEETPAHKVRVDAFCMDKFEVTQKAYRDLMGSLPRQKHPGEDRPAAAVSWIQALHYCNARSQKEGLTPCYDIATQQCDFQADGYRLPTEAEWEYACRAGTTGDYFFGGDPRSLGEYAWYKKDAAPPAPRPVGGLRANPWGLHDLQGNVSEWCNDRYDAKQYRKRQSDNPRGPAGGEYRALRGGNFASGADTCRSSARYYEAPGFADACFGRDAIGFRCVRRAP